jgi:hypothetical protein
MAVLLSDIVKSIEELRRKSAHLQQRLAAKKLSEAAINEINFKIVEAERAAVGVMFTQAELLKNELHFIEQEIIKAENAAPLMK